MSNRFVSEGIALRKIPYGEADEIVTVLFRDGGVRRLFAAGARKSKRRFGGLVDVFAPLRWECLPREGGLWRLIGVEESGTRSFRPDADLSVYAFLNYLSELICEFSPEAADANSLFLSWQMAVARLQGEGFSAPLAVAVLMRFLTDFGYELAIDHCAACGAGIFDGSCFSPERGGVLCATCFETDFAGSRFPSPGERVKPPHPNETAAVLLRLVGFIRTLLQKNTRSEAFFLDILSPIE